MPDKTVPSDADRQQIIWQDRAAKLRQQNAAAEDYAAAYDEINQFLREHGDPALHRNPDGSIYGYSGRRTILLAS